MATECECVSDPVDGPTRAARAAAWSECGRADGVTGRDGDPDRWTGSSVTLECQCECAAVAYWSAYDAASVPVRPRTVEYGGPVDLILSADDCRRVIVALRAYVPSDGAPFDAWLLADRVAQAIEDAAYHASDAGDPYDAHGAGFRGSTVEWYNRGADDAALGFDRDPLVETNAPGRAEYAAYDAGYRRYSA